MILKKLKYYKWALNKQALMDYGWYTESSNASFAFQSTFYSNYIDHFTDNQLQIANASNA